MLIREQGRLYKSFQKKRMQNPPLRDFEKADFLRSYFKFAF